MIEDSFYEQLSEDQKNYVELIQQSILDLDDKRDIKEILAEVYCEGFDNGSDAAMLALADGLRKSIINRNS